MPPPLPGPLWRIAQEKHARIVARSLEEAHGLQAGVGSEQWLPAPNTLEHKYN